MAASFSWFAPRPNRFFTPRTKNTWKGAIKEGVRTIKDFRQVGLCEVELEQAEIAKLRRHEMFQEGLAATFAKKSFIAHEHIRRAQLLILYLGDKAVGLSKGSHQKPSRILETSVRA